MPLREEALRLLKISDPIAKAGELAAFDVDAQAVVVDAVLHEPGPLPGRPAVPLLVPPAEVPRRSPQTPEGHAALIHALSHIEFNAINLALDIVWRFPNMPERFYREWMQVACEEAYHFTLLREHLERLGSSYGAFPAHNGLWDMAQKTEDDVLARLALVPRTLEARGLDVSPALRKKLSQIGDAAGAEILGIILRDEIGHVQVGNRWYRHLCDERRLEAISTYADLAQRYGAPRLRGPFNLEARQAAGFTQAELDALCR